MLKSAARLAVLGACAASSWACATARSVAAGPSPFPHANRPVGAPAPEREAADAGTFGDGVARAALALIGSPYRFGGTTPDGFDCSGLVAYVMAAQGITMPRTVATQFGVGVTVGADDLEIGDLVFFTTTGPGATHVGIVTNADMREFVHAPADGSRVRVDRMDALYWRTRWVGARRVR